MKIPLFDTKTPLQPLMGEIRTKIDEVITGGRFILGPEVAAFEREFSSQVGTKHALGVANGTEAITIALRALGVGPGDEVVVPSFTFYASVEAILPTGATPVFCDIDPENYCVTAETVRAALTPKTKAVIAVHLFGNIAPVDEIAKLGVPVLEDAAQATGSQTSDGRQVGSLGTIATFSFFPSKNLGCFGDGGAITTNDDHLAEQVAMLRFHGSRDKQTFELIGVNSRLDELQAAILRVQLPHINRWAEARSWVGDLYQAAGFGEIVSIPKPIAGGRIAWNLYVVSHPQIGRLADALSQNEIACKAYYRVPVHQQPAMKEWGIAVDLPGTDEAAKNHLALPMSSVLGREAVERIVGVAREAFTIAAVQGSR